MDTVLAINILVGMSHEIPTPNSILVMNGMIFRENHDDTIGSREQNDPKKERLPWILEKAM